MADIQRGEVREVTPEMYGAVGDGVTDDTVAINAAADAARAYGIPFHFSKDYYITDSLNFTSGLGGWCIYGDGQKVTTINANLQSSHPVFDFTATEKVYLHDLYIVGKSGGQQTAGVLFAMGGEWDKGVFPQIERVQIDGVFSKAGLANISADLSKIDNCLIFGPIGVFYGSNDILGINSKYETLTELRGQNTIHSMFAGGVQGTETSGVLVDDSTGSVNAYGTNISLRGTATEAIKVTGNHAKVFWYGCRMESISSAENTYILYAEKAPQYSHFTGSYNINGIGPFFNIPPDQFLTNAFIQIDPGLPDPGQSPQTALLIGGGGYIRNSIIYNSKGINAEIQPGGNRGNTVYGSNTDPWDNFIAGHLSNIWYGGQKTYIGGDLYVSRKLFAGNKEII